MKRRVRLTNGLHGYKGFPITEQVILPYKGAADIAQPNAMQVAYDTTTPVVEYFIEKNQIIEVLR